MADLLEKQSKPKTSALTSDLAPETVGFRLDAEHRRLLAQRARKAGVSVHDFARACVIEALHDRDQLPAIREAILALHAEMNQFQSNFAKATEALLVTANEVDIAEAKAWVQQNLKTE